MKKFLRKWLPKIGLALKADQDWAYQQRDIAAMSAAAFAIQAGYQVDYYMDDNPDWDEEWRRILQISGLVDKNTTTGQISWHLGPKSKEKGDKIFVESKVVPWDGTDWSKSLSTVEIIAL